LRPLLGTEYGENFSRLSPGKREIRLKYSFKGNFLGCTLEPPLATWDTTLEVVKVMPLSGQQESRQTKASAEKSICGGAIAVGANASEPTPPLATAWATARCGGDGSAEWPLALCLEDPRSMAEAVEGQGRRMGPQLAVERPPTPLRVLDVLLPPTMAEAAWANSESA